MDKNLIITARRASIESYLRDNGAVLLKEGKQYRVKNHPGLVVSGNKWYSHTSLEGGNTLDYLIKIEKKNFTTAVEILSNTYVEPIKTDNKPSTLDVPERYANDKRVMAYLIKTRGICACILIPLLNLGRIYESSNTHNCVFTGVDEFSNVRYVMQRSIFPGSNLKFESSGSDKRFSFSLIGTTDTLCVFESPIDLLSYLSINHKYTNLSKHHMLSLAGVNDISLTRYIKTHLYINKIIFCLDNDTAGKNAFKLLYEKYSKKGYKICKHFPKLKDWNHQLLNDR